MKKRITAAVLALSLIVGPALVQAHTTKDPAKMQAMMDKKVAKMTKDLNLNADQQGAVRRALEAKMDKIKSAESEFDNSVRAALNPDQIQKFEKKLER